MIWKTGDTVETKTSGTGVIVGFYKGRIRVKLSNGHLRDFMVKTLRKSANPGIPAHLFKRKE